MTILGFTSIKIFRRVAVLSPAFSFESVNVAPLINSLPGLAHLLPLRRIDPSLSGQRKDSCIPPLYQEKQDSLLGVSTRISVWTSQSSNILQLAYRSNCNGTCQIKFWRWADIVLSLRRALEGANRTLKSTDESECWRQDCGSKAFYYYKTLLNGHWTYSPRCAKADEGEW